MSETFTFDTMLPPSATQRGPAAQAPDASLDVSDLPPISIRTGEAVAGGGLVRERTLGEGGMGRVSLAREAVLDREVAIKEVRSDSPTSVRLLLHEARMMGSLEHPNIIPVHALGVDDAGAPILVMKRVQGATWEDLLRDETHAAWETRHETDPLLRNIEVLEEVCDALEYAHSRGIVHRDVKPANVMVGAQGEVYLLDFGVAARTDAVPRQIAGTPSYMAPEMVTARPVQPTMDVFLLGAVLTEVLLGRPRYVAADVTAALEQVAACAPVDFPPHVDAGLAALANRACLADPAERVPSVAAFQAGLREWKTHRGAVALYRAARTQMQALDGALEADDAVAALAAFSAARFGLQQSLEQWPEHADAREALTGLLDRMLTATIARQTDLDSAASWLAELEGLGAPSAGGHRTALEAARAAVEARRVAEREADMSVGETGRAVFFFLSFALALVAGGAIFTGWFDVSSTVGAVRMGGVWVTFFTLFVVWGLRFMTQTAVTRRFLILVLVASYTMMVNRLGCWWMDVPVAWMFAVDLMMLALMGTVGATVYGRTGLVVFAAINAVGFAMVMAAPAYAVAIFGTTVTLGPLAFTAPLWRRWWARGT